ncbi:restriction endonuclease subunit S [Marivirga lumbricoides]
MLSNRDLSQDNKDRITVRLKDLGTLQNGISKGKDYFGEGFPFVSYGNVYNDSIQLDEIKTLANSTTEDQKQYSVQEGDVFFTRTSETIDEIGISATAQTTIPNAIFSGFVIRLRPNKRLIKKEYSKYFFKADVNRQFLSREINLVTRASLSQNTLSNLPVILPDFKEQTAIAEYLDTKTQAIDKKVNLLEKKIGYHQELRKNLINESVTQGIDKNVELQTSELGFKTPKNWLRYRLKDLGSLYSGLSGKSGDDFNQDDNPDNKGFIPFTNIANNTYLKRDHLGTVVVNEGEKQNRVRKGDIFFLMSSEGYEDIGKSAALAEDIEETYLNSFCKGYRVNPRKTNPYFLNYLMLSDYYRQLLIVEGKGFTRINLKMEKVNDFLVYIPDTLSAQDEIVKFLDAKLDTIAKIIANIQTQITTLKELRKTLINDVVTGKIKVSHE